LVLGEDVFFIALFYKLYVLPLRLTRWGLWDWYLDDLVRRVHTHYAPHNVHTHYAPHNVRQVYFISHNSLLLLHVCTFSQSLILQYTSTGGSIVITVYLQQAIELILTASWCDRRFH
jgi:hypothetical protein